MWTSPIRESFWIASRTETALIPYSRVIFSMEGRRSPAASLPRKIRSRMVRTRLSPTFFATRAPGSHRMIPSSDSLPWMSRGNARGETRGSDRLAPGRPALQPSGQLREGEAHDEVDDGDEKEDLRGIEHRPVVHLGRDVGELRDAHDERQRGVLDHRHELVDEGGDHVPQRLGENDVEHRL